MIAGHVTTTYLLGDILKKNKFSFNIWLLIFGALLPDLIDKSLARIFIYPGRGLAHSLVIQLLIAFFLFREFKKSRQTIIIIFAGALLHLLQDWPDRVILLWPFFGVWNPSYPRTFFEKIYHAYFINMLTVEWWLEIIGATYLSLKILFSKIIKSDISDKTLFLKKTNSSLQSKMATRKQGRGNERVLLVRRGADDEVDVGAALNPNWDKDLQTEA